MAERKWINTSSIIAMAVNTSPKVTNIVIRTTDERNLLITNEKPNGPEPWFLYPTKEEVDNFLLVLTAQSGRAILLEIPSPRPFSPGQEKDAKQVTFDFLTDDRATEQPLPKTPPVSLQTPTKEESPVEKLPNGRSPKPRLSMAHLAADRSDTAEQ